MSSRKKIANKGRPWATSQSVELNDWVDTSTGVAGSHSVPSEHANTSGRIQHLAEGNGAGPFNVNSRLSISGGTDYNSTGSSREVLGLLNGSQSEGPDSADLTRPMNSSQYSLASDNGGNRMGNHGSELSPLAAGVKQMAINDNAVDGGGGGNDDEENNTNHDNDLLHNNHDEEAGVIDAVDAVDAVDPTQRRNKIIKHIVETLVYLCVIFFTLAFNDKEDYKTENYIELKDSFCVKFAKFTRVFKELTQGEITCSLLSPIKFVCGGELSLNGIKSSKKDQKEGLAFQKTFELKHKKIAIILSVGLGLLFAVLEFWGFCNVRSLLSLLHEIMETVTTYSEATIAIVQSALILTS